MLSDRDLIACLQSGALDINPLDKTQIQPASIDLKLGDEFLTSDPDINDMPIDMLLGAEPNAIFMDMGDVKGSNIMTEHWTSPNGFMIESFMIEPGEFVLATTLETVSLCDTLVGRVEGKSSIGRMGLLIHATAGFIDPGFSGQITLELFNLSPVPIRLRAGKPICQLSVSYLSSPAINPYGSEKLNSKYQNQTGVVASRYDG